MPGKKVVPELLCTDIAVTKDFYVRVLQFAVLFDRPAETFVYLSREGVDLMFEQFNGPGRRWITAPLERPFGRGMNLQIEISNVAQLYTRVRELSPSSIYLQIEDKSYQCGDASAVNRQFIVQDPDGYLLRFAQFLS